MNGSEADDVDAELVNSSVFVGNSGLLIFSVFGGGVMVSLVGGVNVITVGSVSGLFCSSDNELQPNTSCW